MPEQTQEADEFKDLFHESGQEDAKKSGGEEPALTLAELESFAGRKFASKEDALKHYQNLNSLVGDQKRLETEKKAKEAEAALSEKELLTKKVEELERKNTINEFLQANPSAKDKLDLVEAYAEKSGITLSEAWKKVSDKFAPTQEEEDEVGVKTKQRITPVQSQNIQALTEQARKGSSDAQEELVKELLWKDR